MKLNHLRKHLFISRRLFNQTMRVMRLTAVLLIATCLQISAKGHAQGISLKEKNASLEKIFKEIKTQTNYLFWYDNDLLRASKKVDITVKNAAIEQVLDLCVAGQGLSYTIVNKLIVVKRKEEPRNANLPETIPLPVAIGGRITNEKGEPLTGVSLRIKGTGKGTTSNEDGHFRITAEANATLTISFIGYEGQEIAVKGRSEINIVLKESTSELDQVVVIGYGATKKATLTGAVSVVNAKQIANRPTAQILNSLQGIVPGMVVTRNNPGRPGGESVDAQIRGVTSRGGAGVLVVIDGIPSMLGIGALGNLSPDEIESITVLKDAQAAIYGSMAAGGVMLVTTKKGKSEKPTIEVNTNLTLNKPGIIRKQVNILQAIDVLNQSYVNDGVVNNAWAPFVKYIDNTDLSKQTIVSPGPFPDTHDMTLGNEDWMDIMWGSALQKNVNIAVSGRTERSNYYVSAGLLDQPSMMQYGTDYNRKYNVRLKYGFDITRYLSINTNVALSNQKRVEPVNYSIIEDFTAQSLAGKSMYSSTGKYYGWGGYLSPIGLAEKGGISEGTNTSGNAQVELILKPLKNLEIRGQYSTDQFVGDASYNKIGVMSYAMDDTEDFSSTVLYGGRDQVGASYLKSAQNVANIYGTYKYVLKKNTFGLLAGFSNTQFNTRQINASRNGDPALISNNLIYLGAGSPDQQFNGESKSANALSSAFSRLSYDYQEKYIFEGNFRYDASSNFAPGHKGTPFYGASAAWVFTKEKIFSGIDRYLNSGKLRASWGQLGNQSGIGFYDYIQLIAAGGQYPFGDPESPTRNLQYSVPYLASPSRSWEKVETKNIGLDIGALNDRLTGSFDYFIKKNMNMFYTFEFPSILGITSPSINGAQLRTTGWELSVNWNDKITPDLNYSFGFLLSDNTSKVLSLPDSRTPGYGYNTWVEGYSAGSYFTYQFDGLIQSEKELADYKSAITSGAPTNLRTGDARYKDMNGDGKLTPLLYDAKDPSKGGDMVYIGNDNRRYSFSFNLGLNYKGFYATALFQGVGKQMVWNNNINQFMFFRNPQQYYYNRTWTPENTMARYPKLSADNGILGWNYKPSNAPYIYEDAAYLRLKNLQVGYTFSPQLLKRIHMEGLQIYFSGADLTEWSKIPKGFEVERPFVVSKTPYPRSYTLGLNFSL